MMVYEFGSMDSPVLLFVHGSCTCWNWYQESIDALAVRYRVIVPAICGFDIDHPSDFISVEQTVEELTEYLLQIGHDALAVAYGGSLGGSMILKLLADGRIKVRDAVIDGGITPYCLPRWITTIIRERDYWSVRLLRSHMAILKMVYPPKRWLRKGHSEDESYQEMYDFLHTLSKTTIRNAFFSANNYSMPDTMPSVTANIEYWYGSAEKRARASNAAYVKKTIPVRCFSGIVEYGTSGTGDEASARVCPQNLSLCRAEYYRIGIAAELIVPPLY